MNAWMTCEWCVCVCGCALVGVGVVRVIYGCVGSVWTVSYVRG